MRGRSVPKVPRAAKRPKGGFVLISVMKLAMTWWAFRTGLIRALDLRVYFACHLVVAARCRTMLGRVPSFTHAELAKRTGVGEKSTRASLRRLERAGLLTWSESGITFSASPDALACSDLSGFWAMFERLPNRKRLVPVPRRILRLIANGASPSLIATVIGHLIRCLYYWPDEGCRSHGSCKSSWIASVFGISLRGAKSARKVLVELGWLVRKKAPQWRMNRNGLQVEINLDWQNPRMHTVNAPPAELPQAEPPPSETTGHEVAPPPAENCTAFAPPDSDKELSYGESKNQKPASGGPAGVCIHESKKEEPTREPTPPAAPPTLCNVVSEDLRDTGRLLELHRQAVDAGLITSCEQDRLRFISAAEHARAIGKANPCGLFMHLVRSKLWHFPTQDDEDRANARLKMHLFGVPRERVPAARKPVFHEAPLHEAPSLSPDARLVQAVRSAASRAGFRGDPFYLLKREKPEWTRDRWDRAVSELDAGRNARTGFHTPNKLAELCRVIPSLVGAQI